MDQTHNEIEQTEARETIKLNVSWRDRGESKLQTNGGELQWDLDMGEIRNYFPLLLCYPGYWVTTDTSETRWDEALHDGDHETQVRDDDHENTENTENTGMRDWAGAGGKN